MAFEFTRQRKIAYGIIAVLAVILVGVLLYTQLAPTETAPESGAGADVARVGALRADEAAEPFNVEILQHPDYLSLDRALLDAGRLPVSAPESRGKPNPFGL